MTARAPTVLFVPGLRGHVPEHWQSLLAAELPESRTVPPMAVKHCTSPRTSAPVPPMAKCTPHFCSSVCTSV